MKNKLKKIATMCLSAMMITTLSIQPAKAVTGVGSQGAGSINSAMNGNTYNSYNMGVRVYAVDSSGSQVGKVIDITNGDPQAFANANSSGILIPTAGTKVGDLTVDVSNYGSYSTDFPSFTTDSGSTMSSMPLPIEYSDGSFNTKGISMREYLLGIRDSGITQFQNFIQDGSENGDLLGLKSAFSSTESAMDIMIANDVKVIMEPLMWFQPYTYYTSDGVNYVTHYDCFAALGITPTYYGTPTGIAQALASAGVPDSVSESAGNYGASDVILRRAFPNSMVVDEAITSPNLSSFSGYSSISGTSLSSMSSTSQGHGVHVYRAADFGASTSTQTNDPFFPTPTPHPAPEPPPTPTDPAPTDLTYSDNNIVKVYGYYTDEAKTILAHEATEIKEETVKEIAINDETTYTVKEWYVKDDFDGTIKATDWDSKKPSSFEEGTGSVKLADNKSQTLYVLLVQSSTVVSPSAPGGDIELTLTQSQISATSDLKTDGSSALTDFKWNRNAFPDDTTTVKYTLNAGSYDLSAEPVLSSDPKIYGNVSLFEALAVNTVKTGSDIKGAESNYTFPTNATMQYTYWRGEDQPTIAKYMNSSVVDGLLDTTNESDNIVSSARKDSDYTDSFTLTVKDTSDDKTKTATKKTYTYNSTSKSYVLSSTSTVSLNFDTPLTSQNYNVNVEVLAAPGGKSGLAYAPTSYGTAVEGNTITYFPYVQMTYQKTGDTDKTDVYVLAEEESTLKLNAWATTHHESTASSNNLLLESYQFSIHAKATQNTTGDSAYAWRQQDNVLPGGAIYTLTSTDTTTVTVESYLPYIDTDMKDILTSNTGALTLTEAFTVTTHETLVDESIDSLNAWNLVQHINKNPNATDITSGTSQWFNSDHIGVSGKLSSVFGTSTPLNTDDKYHLNRVTSATPISTSNPAGEADIDVLNKDTASTTTIDYHFSADTEGTITITKGGSTLVTISKTEGIAKVHTITELKLLDDRTKCITNFIDSLNRNEGDDTSASWASDGKWYNEGSLGFTMRHQTTILEVGLEVPRLSVLDPVLSQGQTSQSDMFATAVSSQYKVETSSGLRPTPTYSTGFIGSFVGTEVFLYDVAGSLDATTMFTSQIFAIPNTTVSDLD